MATFVILSFVDFKKYKYIIIVLPTLNAGNYIVNQSTGIFLEEGLTLFCWVIT